MDCHEFADANSRNDDRVETLLFAKAKRSKNFYMVALRTDFFVDTSPKGLSNDEVYCFFGLLRRLQRLAMTNYNYAIHKI